VSAPLFSVGAGWAAEQPVAADGPLRGPPLNRSVRRHMMVPSNLRFTYHEFHQYYSWCKAAAAEMKEARTALDAYGPSYEDGNFSRKIWKTIVSLEERIEKNLVLAPVLCVMSAEQLIVTYAMQRLSDPMISALTHIDRLDTLAKWETFPLMACGKHLGADSEGLRQLRIQIRQRNSFIHPKPIIASVKDEDHMDRIEHKIESGAKQRLNIAALAPACVDQLAKELIALDKHSRTKLACRMAGILPHRRSGT